MRAPIYAGVWERQRDRDGTVVRTVSWPVKDGKQSMMAEGMLCEEVRIQDLRKSSSPKLTTVHKGIERKVWVGGLGPDIMSKDGFIII